MNHRYAAAPVLAALAFALPTANAAPLVLYEGGSAPTSQGWVHLGDAGSVESAAGTTRFQTNDTGNGRTSERAAYAYATGARNFIVSIRMSVEQASYNIFDGGLVFSALGNTAQSSPADRQNSLMLGDGQVLWGDQQGGAASVSEGVFHDYTLRYLDGRLDFFVDATFDDIIANSAVALLSRSNVQPFAGSEPGLIVFGDNTNDRGVNSRYTVERVRFQDLDVPAEVPEPTSTTLAGLALLGLWGVTRRPAAPTLGRRAWEAGRAAR